MTLAGTAAIAVGLPACGSGSKPSSSRATSAAAGTSTPATTTAAASGSGTSSVISGPVRATLRGASHAPVVKKNWIYTVTATDAAGHPLSGTVLTEFVVGGQVVGHETPPMHTLRNGHLKDVIQYPAQSLGVPIILQTVVKTRLGSVTLDWPVKVTG